MFDTGRTILRPYKESDLSHLVDLANDDPEVQSTLMFSGYPNLRYESMREFAQATSKEHFMGLAWDKETGDFVGYIKLRTSSARNRSGEVAIALKREWRGKGLGTEILQWMTAYAFKVMGLHRVVLTVAETNSAGIAVYKKM
ncbi:acyl-CoA N-acyltransferase [Artomyces pyxidatus]|uniref:Acyl-CoA N-acyltransferase n=1 Tax=Artomyces pyxidatus TaxID=48021 RepID=A0ACB8TAG0_9AGAM|nr:acyl-CoA N-acyltransferase [Artomyces pyxidatus]